MFVFNTHSSSVILLVLCYFPCIFAASLVPTVTGEKIDSLNVSSTSTAARASESNPSAKRSGDLWYLEQSVPWPPMPYSFGYEVRDPYGNEQYRRETGDSTGAVNGAYSYWGPDGIYRQVDYVADENGFRAKIKTSEPGTSSENPADVIISSNPVSSIPLPYIPRGPPASPPPPPPLTSSIVLPPPSSTYRTPDVNINRQINSNYNPSANVAQTSRSDNRNNNQASYGQVNAPGARREGENSWQQRSPGAFDSPPRRGTLYDEPRGLSYGGFGVRTSLPPTTTQRPPSKISINPDGPRRTTRIFSKTNRDRYNHPMKTNNFDSSVNNITPPPPVRSSKGKSFNGPAFAPQDVQVTDDTRSPPTQSRIRTTRQMSHETSIGVITPSPSLTGVSLPDTSRMARKPTDTFFMKDQINDSPGVNNVGPSGHSSVREHLLTHSIYVNSGNSVTNEVNTKPSSRTEDPISGVMYEESFSDHRGSIGNFVKPPTTIHHTWSPTESSSASPSSNSPRSLFHSTSDKESIVVAAINHDIPRLIPNDKANASSLIHPLPLLPKFYRTGLLEVPAPPTDSPMQQLAKLRLQLPPGTGDPATIATSTTTTPAPDATTTTLTPTGRLAFDENRPAYYSSYKETQHPPPQSSAEEDDSVNNFSSARYISVSENGHTVLYPARPISYQYHRQVVSLRPRKMVSGLFTTRNPKKYSPAFTMNSFDERKHFAYQTDQISTSPLEHGRSDGTAIDSRENRTIDLIMGQSNAQALMKRTNSSEESAEENEISASGGDASTLAPVDEANNNDDTSRFNDNISTGIIHSSESAAMVDPTGDIGYASDEDVDTSEGEEIESDEFDESSTEEPLVGVTEATDVPLNTTESIVSPMSASLVQETKLEDMSNSEKNKNKEAELQQSAIEDEDISSEDLWV